MKKYLILGIVTFILSFLLISCTQESLKQCRNISLNVPSPAPNAKYVGSKACEDCHDKLYSNFKSNIHAKITAAETPIGKTGCETCHGPGSVHIDEEDPEKIINPAKVDAVEASAICLKCHTGDEHQDWNGSEHSLNDVSCVKCHKIHGNSNEYLLVKPEPELCYTCHRKIQAKSYYPSHHPIKEGKIKCSDCHANHGSLLNNLKTDERLNDLCLKCHTRYQGPFTYEHEPVVENCTICHDPHGSVAQNLLKQNEPFLCLQCHHLHFHTAIQSSQRAARGNFVTPAQSTMTLEGKQNPHMTQILMGTKCTTCHSAVHGSDLPSLSIPSQGRHLTR